MTRQEKGRETIENTARRETKNGRGRVKGEDMYCAAIPVYLVAASHHEPDDKMKQ